MNMQVLNNPAFGQVRVKMIKKEPWFVAKDLCDALGLQNSRKAVADLEEYLKADVTISDTSSNGVTQKRNVNIVNESGLYQLIFQSRKKQAKQFQRWVTSEVLPSIRKYGFYSTDGKKIARAEKRIAEKKVSELLKLINNKLSETDKRLVAKQCLNDKWYIEDVLFGRVKDVYVVNLLYARAIGNKKINKIYYTAEGAQKLIDEMSRNYFLENALNQ